MYLIRSDNNNLLQCTWFDLACKLDNFSLAHVEWMVADKTRIAY